MGAMITDSLQDLVRAALERAAADGVLTMDTVPPISFERPKRREHGDWATNVALAAAKGQGRPRDIAEAIVERLRPYAKEWRAKLVEESKARLAELQDARKSGTIECTSGTP